MAVVEVHVIPAEAEQLALAEAGRHCRYVKSLEALDLNACQELADLLGGQRPDFVDADFRWIDQRANVTTHEAPFECLTQSPPQDRPHELDGSRGQTRCKLPI